MDSHKYLCDNIGMGRSKPKITEEHIKQINQLIIENPNLNRTALSKKLCKMWDWQSLAGQMKDMSARNLLRALDKKGLISLPAAERVPRAAGKSADKIAYIDHDVAQIDAKLHEVRPIRIEIATSNEDVHLFKSYIHQYHYLKFDRSIGENMKYFVLSNSGVVLSCLMFGSAAWSCADRDYFIGWNKEQRTRNLIYLASNTRFIIFPWIRIPHLASHILGAIARRISDDWQKKYGHILACLETCVERDRYRGVCYEAANWFHVGESTGLGRNSKNGEKVLPIKDIWIYPLYSDFIEILCGNADSANSGAGRILS